MYESGKEDIDNEEIEEINSQSKKREDETERARLDTMRQMEINKETIRLKEIEEQKQKEEQEKKLEGLSNYLGIPKINERLDELNISQNEIISKLSQVIQVLNNGVPQAAPIQEGVQADPMAKMELIGSLVDKAVNLYSTYKQNAAPQGTPALIDQNFINQRMVESFMEDLDTGKSISTFIKNSLKKTATRNIVNTALKDIGVNDSNDPA